MAPTAGSFTRLNAMRKEQVPQALARLAVVSLFVCLWVILLLAGIPMPFPFLVALLIEIAFFVAYLRIVFLLPKRGLISVAQYVMLAAEIGFHTTMVYFLGGVSWLGAFAYVFGLIFTNAYLDIRKGLIYTSGASMAFATLVLLEATGTIPHYQYMDQGPLRYADPRFVATTLVGASGVFFSIYLWSSWVGRELRRERDAAVSAQDELLRARVELIRSNEELEARVVVRTAELEQVNAALSESQQQMRLVLETCPDLISIQEPNGRYRFVNSAFTTVLGYAPAQLVGQTAADIIHPDDLEAVRERFRTMVSFHQPAEATFRFQHADGHWVSLEANGRVLVDGSGEVTGVVVVSRDVTERTRAEEALRESEERFRSLTENTFDLICEAGADARFSYLSPNYKETLGYAPEELLGTSIFDLIHPDDQPGVVEEFAKAVTTRTSGQAAFRFRHKNGGWQWFESAGRAFETEAGALRAVIVSRDITERKRAEEALRESEARLRTVVTNVSVVLFAVDKNGIVTLSEGRGLDALGVKPGENVGKSIDEIYSDTPQVAENLRRALAGESFTDVLLIRDLYYETHYSPVRTSDGSLSGVIGVATNITERRRALEAIRQSEAALKATIESTADGILVVDRDGKVAYTNRRFAKMWNIPDSLIAMRDDDKLLEFVLSELSDADAFLTKVRELYQSTEESLDELLFKDGRVFERYSRPLELDGAIAGRVWSFRDVTEQKRAEEALNEQARRDPLTGLLNRRAGLAAVDEHLATAKRTNSPLAVLILDLDRFKLINDRYSHETGDAALASFSNVMTRLVGNKGIVCRLGGDEFEIALDHVGIDGALRFGERLRAALKRALKESVTQLPPFTVSSGIACFPEDGQASSDLARRADEAMYAAKAGGADAVCAWRKLGNRRVA